MKTNIKSFVEAHGQKIYNDFYKIGQTCVTVLRLKFKKSQYEIIQKDITEEIAREVLNNSTMLRKYQPFEKPYSETSGEDDNIGNGLSIDTKLLLFNNACYSLAQNPRVIIENQKEFEFILNISESYKHYKNGQQASTQFQVNHYKMIKDIEAKLVKFHHKNLLFIYPFPLQDVLYLDDGTFEKSYVGSIFVLFKEIMQDIGYNKRLFFTYPIINNDYNLVEITKDFYISEALIESEIQKKYIPIVEFGVLIKENDLFLPYHLKFNYQKPHITKSNW